MTKKRGDDQYGYDPKRAAARSLRERLERQAEQRPDKPAQKLGDVLKLPKVTPTTKRLIDAHAEIIDGPADDIAFSHSVLCQTSLPYRPTDERVWIRDQGNVSLLIEAGRARHPDTGKWVELPLPHGEKPRLVMLHLNGEALRTGSPDHRRGRKPDGVRPGAGDRHQWAEPSHPARPARAPRRSPHHARHRPGRRSRRT